MLVAVTSCGHLPCAMVLEAVGSKLASVGVRLTPTFAGKDTAAKKGWVNRHYFTRDRFMRRDNLAEHCNCEVLTWQS